MCICNDGFDDDSGWFCGAIGNMAAYKNALLALGPSIFAHIDECTCVQFGAIEMSDFPGSSRVVSIMDMIDRY